MLVCAGCYLNAAAGLRFYAACSRSMRRRLDEAGAFWQRMYRLKGQETLRSLSPAGAASPSTASPAHSVMGRPQRRGRAAEALPTPPSYHNTSEDPPQRRGRT